MKKQKVIVLSYVPPYNRQGMDIARALRRTQADVALYQLQGTDDLAHDEHGISWTKPHGTFSKFHVLWNILKFVFPTIFRRKDIVICVGRPILIAGALYKKWFGCRLVYYALEYAQLGRMDRWAIRQCDRYIDVEENRCRRVVEQYNLNIPTLVIHNMPPLQKRPKGDSLRRFLAEKYGVAQDARLIVYAGSYQWYACLPQIIEASADLPDDAYVVLMTFNLPDELKNHLPPRCLVIPPVQVPAFYDWLADADCALLPYEDENDFNVQNCSPQKLFDCYVTGTPYIASDRPIIRKTLEFLPEAGVLCDFTNVLKIRNSLKDVQRKRQDLNDKMAMLHSERFNYGAVVGTVRQFIQYE